MAEYLPLHPPSSVSSGGLADSDDIGESSRSLPVLSPPFTLHHEDGLIIALGAVIFGLLYARVYDVHSPPPPDICVGRECWKDTLLAAGWAGLFATILLFGIWHWNWRKRGWVV